jgi:hypothetical protein
VGGIGDDEAMMIDGARVFDVTLPDGPGRREHDARELTAFAGPAGSFFSDGRWLFSSDPTGLSRWDCDDGARTGHLPGFRPTHYHRAAGELVQISGGVLVRWEVTG